MKGREVRAIVRKALVARGTDAATLQRFDTIRWPTGKVRLLGSSKKVEKGRKQGSLNTVLYLAPADASLPYGGANVCPKATAGCRAVCLGRTSGQLARASGQNAELWKTLLFLRARSVFLELLREEIAAHEAKANRLGLLAVVRLNGTSDIVWPDWIYHDFPGVQFYAYTKLSNVARAWARGELPPNLHVTFSWAETFENQRDAVSVAREGGNIAAVLRTKDPEDFPDRFLGLPVVNGDEHDDRFRDPQGCVVALTAKGTAMEDNTGFVVDLPDDED